MKIINIGILAHVDAGKTTLTESCYMPAEPFQNRGASKKGQRGRTPCFWSGSVGLPFKRQSLPSSGTGCKVNIVDTPGHMDFLAEVYRSLAVLDGAILVISAKDGVQAQTRILFHACGK